MSTDPLKDAMKVYAPELAKDYKDFVRTTLKNIQEDLGVGLKGVFGSGKWYRPFSAIRGSIVKKYPPGVHSLRPEESDKIPYKIHEEKLDKNADEYGERVAIEWYEKINLKVGGLSRVSTTRPRGGDIKIVGYIDGDKIVVDQQRIINVSSRGTLFHQFPARIYLNEKFISEAKYKKLLLVKDREASLLDPIRIIC